VVVGCEPTIFAGIQLGTVFVQNADWQGEPANELTAEAYSFASFINPYLTAMDPVMMSGTILTISGPGPTATRTHTTATTTSAISVTSCGMHS